MIDIRRVIRTHGHIYATRVVESDVLDGGTEDGSVRDDDPAIVRRIKLGREQAQIYHFSCDTCCRYHIIHLEGTEDQQHEAGREVTERSLHGQADGETGSTKHGGETGGLEPENVQAPEKGHDQDQILDKAPEEARDSQVESAFGGTGNPLAGPLGDDPRDDQQDDDPDDFRQKVCQEVHNEGFNCSQIMAD